MGGPRGSKRLADPRAWIDRPGLDAASVCAGVILAGLAAAAILYRRLSARHAPRITDEMVRQIEREGWIEVSGIGV